MKKFLALLSISFLSLGATALATPAYPECTGTYSKTVTLSGWGSSYTGTAANEIIIVNSGGGSVDARGGDDCIIVNAWGNYVLGGAGQDIIIANQGGGTLDGQGGNDKIVSKATGDYLNGGTGTDTCDYNSTSYANSCEL